MYGIDYTNLLINVNQFLQDMFKSFDIDKAFNFFGVHFRAGLADSNDCVDGGFYLKRYKKQPDVKQVAKGLLTHCLKHIHNQSENNDRHVVFKPSMCSCKSGLIGAFMEFNINSMQFLMF
jgi:hypothetical protein